MKKQKEVQNNAVGLLYLYGAFDGEDLQFLDGILKQNELEFVSHVTPPRSIAGIEEFFPQIQIFLSSDIVQTICLGVATNTIYDAIKYFVLSVRNLARKKPMYKVEASKGVTKVTPTIHFNIGKMHAVLPVEIDDEKFKYFVDKAFETADEKTLTTETYFVYSEKTGEARHYTQNELVQQAYQEAKLKETI